MVAKIQQWFVLLLALFIPPVGKDNLLVGIFEKGSQHQAEHTNVFFVMYGGVDGVDELFQEWFGSLIWMVYGSYRFCYHFQNQVLSFSESDAFGFVMV